MELRLASFLHELGHIKNNADDSEHEEGDELFLLHERRAWEYAFALTEELGLSFSNRTKNWCRTQLGMHIETVARRSTPVERAEMRLWRFCL